MLFTTILLLYRNAFFVTFGFLDGSCLFYVVVFVLFCAAHDVQVCGTWFVRVANACMELFCSEHDLRACILSLSEDAILIFERPAYASQRSFLVQ